MVSNQSKGIKRILSFAGRYRGLLTFARCLSGISALFIIGPFICVYFAARELIAVFLGDQLNGQALLNWGLFALGLELVGVVLYFLALLSSHIVAFHIQKNLQMAALRHLAHMPIGYFNANPSGKLRKIIDENSFQTETFIAHQLPDLTGAQVTLIAGVCFMIIFDWRIGVPLIILYGMAFYLQSSLMGKNSAEFMRIYQDAQETMNHEAVEYIRGIAVVKVFGQTVKSFAKFHNAIETYKKYALAYTMSCKKGMVAFNAIVNSSFLVLVPIGFLVGFTTPTLRDFIQSFLFYVIFSPACAVMLNKIMYMTSYKMQAEESMRRIDMILTSKQQPEPAIPQYPDTYEVAFEDVTFAYDNTDHPAVSHLTFMAKAGAITALVGHSGSGKSTAASLIPRFYDVQDGAVKIGGVDIREIPQGDLMKMVAFVFQDPKLFKDSLLENIRAGRPSATREEVLKAAHLAQCDDILKKLPNGIDTIIGSQGIYLSGGETQRISIARAILKDAPIVVLDEATAYAIPTIFNVSSASTVTENPVAFMCSSPVREMVFLAIPRLSFLYRSWWPFFLPGFSPKNRSISCMRSKCRACRTSSCTFFSAASSSGTGRPFWRYPSRMPP